MSIAIFDPDSKAYQQLLARRRSALHRLTADDKNSQLLSRIIIRIVHELIELDPDDTEALGRLITKRNLDIPRLLRAIRDQNISKALELPRIFIARFIAITSQFPESFGKPEKSDDEVPDGFLIDKPHSVRICSYRQWLALYEYICMLQDEYDTREIWTLVDCMVNICRLSLDLTNQSLWPRELLKESPLPRIHDDHIDILGWRWDTKAASFRPLLAEMHEQFMELITAWFLSISPEILDFLSIIHTAAHSQKRKHPSTQIPLLL